MRHDLVGETFPHTKLISNTGGTGGKACGFHQRKACCSTAGQTCKGRSGGGLSSLRRFISLSCGSGMIAVKVVTWV